MLKDNIRRLTDLVVDDTSKEKTKAPNLNPNLETFSGRTDEDIKRWLDVMELNFMACKLDEKQFPLLVLQFLRDSALAFFYELDVKKLTWKEFRDEFINKFESPHLQIELRTQLKGLRCRTSIQDYVNEFNKIKCRIVNMSDLDAVDHFASHLPDMFRKRVLEVQTNDLNVAQTMALMLERVHGFHKPDSINFAKSRFKKPFQKRASQQVKNQYYNKNQGVNKSITCHSCGRRGHIAKDCYSKAKLSRLIVSTHQNQTLEETIVQKRTRNHRRWWSMYQPINRV